MVSLFHCVFCPAGFLPLSLDIGHHSWLLNMLSSVGCYFALLLKTWDSSKPADTSSLCTDGAFFLVTQGSALSELNLLLVHRNVAILLLRIPDTSFYSHFHFPLVFCFPSLLVSILSMPTGHKPLVGFCGMDSMSPLECFPLWGTSSNFCKYWGSHKVAGSSVLCAVTNILATCGPTLRELRTLLKYKGKGILLPPCSTV